MKKERETQFTNTITYLLTYMVPLFLCLSTSLLVILLPSLARTHTHTPRIHTLRHPIAAAVSGVLYNLGNVLFLKGYADTNLKVETARFKKGGVIKWLGYFGVVFMSVKVAGTCNKWW